MTDFPRGWTLSNVANAGSAATITVPATAGVVHVLDSLTATLVAFAAAAGATAPQIAINTGGGNVIFGAVAFNGGATGRDEESLSGLDLATAPGGALTVAFSAVAPANYFQVLVIQGHDI